MTSKVFTPETRNVFIVLSSRSMPYAGRCIRTLMENCLQKLSLTLITDSAEDKQEIVNQVSVILQENSNDWCVYSKEELDVLAKEKFGHYPNFLKYREGHPCWRKVTDPLILAGKDEEVIILDPDLYFPNKFTFEPTLEHGVQLMHQNANCLLPPPAVEEAFAFSGTLVDHVDIGIAQLRAGSLDLQWFDNFAGSLNLEQYRPFMHVEAITWSALAKEIGGGYFDKVRWRCWQRGQVKRILIALGVKGYHMIRLEPLSEIKCIHVSGPSKWWVDEAEKKGTLREYGNVYDTPSPLVPFVPLSLDTFRKVTRMKDTLRKLGYYKLTRSG